MYREYDTSGQCQGPKNRINETVYGFHGLALEEMMKFPQGHRKVCQAVCELVRDWLDNASEV